MTEEWLHTFSELTGLSDKNRETLTRMLSASHLQQGYVLLFNHGVPVACGLGVIQNGYLGLYDIVTSPAHRRKRMAEQLLLALLNWGEQREQRLPFCKLCKRIRGLQPCMTSWVLRRSISIGIE